MLLAYKQHEHVSVQYILLLPMHHYCNVFLNFVILNTEYRRKIEKDRDLINKKHKPGHFKRSRISKLYSKKA
jgi:hypothetical protein